MKKHHRLPKELMVYVFDEDEDGTPLWAVATSLDQIHEEHDGRRIGIYSLKNSPTFIVRRDLK